MLKELDTKTWKREDILREANLQSGAIARLSTWKRLAYSVVGVGFIVGIWGSNQQLVWAQVLGGVCLVLGLPASGLLALGVKRAKDNVEHMLEAAGIDAKELLKPRSHTDKGKHA